MVIGEDKTVVSLSLYTSSQNTFIVQFLLSYKVANVLIYVHHS